MSISFRRRSALASAKRVRLSQGSSDVASSTATTARTTAIAAAATITQAVSSGALPTQVIPPGYGSFLSNANVADSHRTNERVTLQDGVVRNNIYYQTSKFEINRFDLTTMTELAPIRIPPAAAWFDSSGYTSVALFGNRYLVTLPDGSYDSGDTYVIPVYDLQEEEFVAPLSLTLPTHGAWNDTPFHSLRRFSDDIYLASPYAYFGHVLKLSFDGTAFAATFIAMDTSVFGVITNPSYYLSPFVRLGTSGLMVAFDVSSSAAMNGALFVTDVAEETCVPALGGVVTLFNRQGHQIGETTYTEAQPFRIGHQATEQEAVAGYVNSFRRCWDAAWVPSLSSLVLAPFNDLFITRLQYNAETQTFAASKHMMTFPDFFEGRKWGKIVHNATRNSLMLFPASHSTVVEVRWESGRPVWRRYVTLLLPEDTDAFKFCDAIVRGSDVLAFPLFAIQPGVMKIPLAMNPAQPIESRY